jgi:hypothetical protein
MAYSLTIRDLINDVVITKDGFATVTEAKKDAERYIYSSKADRWHCQNLGVAGKFRREGLVTIDVLKNDKKYATYAWLPSHPRYVPHLVLRGGYFRKAAA